MNIKAAVRNFWRSSG